MNAGYIMEQIALFLCTKGLGTCFPWRSEAQNGKSSKREYEIIIYAGIWKEQRKLYQKGSGRKENGS